jgi:hypothetical protein
MYAEFVPLFSSQWVNVTCDETYDLGKGKTRERVAGTGVGQLYLEHLHWLRDLCARYGKRIMFWGDIIKKYPDLIEAVPKDAVVLNWGYEPDTDYDSTALFREAGLTLCYEAVWLACNKRSNLDEILTMFRRLAAEARAAAGG